MKQSQKIFVPALAIQSKKKKKPIRTLTKLPVKPKSVKLSELLGFQSRDNSNKTIELYRSKPEAHRMKPPGVASSRMIILEMSLPEQDIPHSPKMRPSRIKTGNAKKRALRILNSDEFMTPGTPFSIQTRRLSSKQSVTKSSHLSRKNPESGIFHKSTDIHRHFSTNTKSLTYRIFRQPSEMPATITESSRHNPHYMPIYTDYDY